MSFGSQLFWAQTSIVILAILFFSIQMIWIIRYWLSRKQDYVASRQCTATLFVCAGACFYQLWIILSILWRAWNIMRPHPYQLILSTILYVLILGPLCYIFMYKSWMLWYTMSLTDALTDIEWLTYISKQNKSNNWFIKNESSFGNPKYILTFTVVALCIFAALGVIPFPSESIEYKLIFLMSSLFPSTVIGIISYKTHCVDDIFKIKQEITTYCRLGAPSLLSLYIQLFCIKSAHSFLYLIFIFIPSLSLFVSVYFQTQYIIKTFQYNVYSDSMQMTPVSPPTSNYGKRLDLNAIASNSPRTAQTPAPIKIKTDPSSTPTASSHAHQQTPSGGFFNITPHRPSPSAFDSMDISGQFPDISDLKAFSPRNRIKLIDIIQDPHWFALFIRHITKEFAFENLLYIVETVQFQQRLIKELQNEHKNKKEAEDDEAYPKIPTHIHTLTITDEINHVKSQNTHFKFKDLTLPSSLPQSPIVYDDCQNWFQYLSNIVLPKKQDEEQSDHATTDHQHSSGAYNPYKQSVLIYNKYLKSSGVLAVNISSEQRRKFNQMFEINLDDKDKREKIYLLSKEQLVDVWEESQSEVWNLLASSFRRFKKTPVFVKISSER